GGRLGRKHRMKAMRFKIALLLSLLSLPAMLLVATGGPAAAAPHHSAASAVTSSSLGSSKPTFTGPAATGCASGCHLLTGPIHTPSTAHLSASQTQGRFGTATSGSKALPLLRPHVPVVHGPTVTIPTVSCQPLRAGCDNISSFAGGAASVKGINAVDSASLKTNFIGDIEPPDQGLCAGNGSVVETNNIGEILIFNKALKRTSPVIPLNTVMGLTQRHWSSGGDPSCLFDPANGGRPVFSPNVFGRPARAGGPLPRRLLPPAPNLLGRHRGVHGLEPVRPVQRLLPQCQLRPEGAGLSLPAQRLREDLGHPGCVPAVLRRVPAERERTRPGRRLVQRRAGIRVQQER